MKENPDSSGDITELTLAAAAEAIRRRQLSPLELTQAYLLRIEEQNPAINAYLTIMGEQAVDSAKRSTEEISRSGVRGPMHGIPVGVKDVFAVAGVRATAGSKFLSDFVPHQDAFVVQRLRQAGAILLGKHNMHEFGYGVTTNNPHHGPTRNPWNKALIPGGSSGGSAAAVAARMAAGALGTDTGGSVRIPASLCGVVGLKPTFGLISKAGAYPLSHIFDHAGVITRTVEDAAILLEAVVGYDPGDGASLRIPPQSYGHVLTRDLRGLRIGLPRRFFFDRLDGEIAASMDAVIGVFRDLGAEVQDIDVDVSINTILGLFGIVLAIAKQLHAERLRERPVDFGPDVGAILSSPTPPGDALGDTLIAVELLTQALRKRLEEVDLLLTPTTPIAAIPLGQEIVQTGGQDEPTLLALIRNTAPFSAAHLPALSIPCGFNRQGLPLGAQLVGRPLDEAILLRAGHAYQAATEWHRQKPPGIRRSSTVGVAPARL